MSNQGKDEWGEPIQRLDYRRPSPSGRQPGGSFSAFFLGLVLGCMFTAGYFYVVLIVSKSSSSLLPYGSLIIKCVAGWALMARGGPLRSFGIGVLVSIPLGLLIFFGVVCGIV